MRKRETGKLCPCSCNGEICTERQKEKKEKRREEEKEKVYIHVVIRLDGRQRRHVRCVQLENIDLRSVCVVFTCRGQGVRGSQSVGSASGAAAQGVNRSRSTVYEVAEGIYCTLLFMYKADQCSG